MIEAKDLLLVISVILTGGGLFCLAFYLDYIRAAIILEYQGEFWFVQGKVKELWAEIVSHMMLPWDYRWLEALHGPYWN